VARKTGREACGDTVTEEELEVPQPACGWKQWRKARKDYKAERREKGKRERQRPNPDAPNVEYRAKDCITVPRLNPTQQKEMEHTGKATLTA
jgi:hypothetical protein